MLTTPSTAFVGWPDFVDNGGSAWNARYRYDEPSTSTSGLALILLLVVALCGVGGRLLDALDRPRALGQRERTLLAAARGARGEHCAQHGDAHARHAPPLRASNAAMR